MSAVHFADKKLFRKTFCLIYEKPPVAGKPELCDGNLSARFSTVERKGQK